MQKTQRNVTQADVAQRAGVSRGAVSVVLSGNGSALGLSTETRQRIRRAAVELRYHPNAIARGLKQGRMNTIGIVSTGGYSYVPGMDGNLISNAYIGPVIQGIIDVASENLQAASIFHGGHWADPNQVIPAYCDGRNDGLLLITPNEQVLDTLSHTNIPLVVIGASSVSRGFTSVDIDDEAATRTIVSHLLEQGHRRIAMITAQCPSFDIRREAYVKVLTEYGAPVRADFIFSMVWGQDLRESIRNTVARLLNLPVNERPTAIFDAHDEFALFAIQAIMDLGFRVPEDLSVVGIDDAPDARTMGLTTVRQYPRRVGARATELLLGMIDGTIEIGAKEYLDTELIVRGSVARVS